MSDGLEVLPGLTIPRSELEFSASRSGGPGGQHVNTSSTRIELRWSVANSRALDDAQRRRVTAAAGRRMGSDGSLRLVASEYRSQQRNRQAAEERLVSLLKRALAPQRRRVATAPTRASVERRLSEKRRTSDRKRQRREMTEE